MDKKAKERSFFNDTFAHDGRASASKYYAIAQKSRAYFNECVMTFGKGVNVLEYGCGTGSSAYLLSAYASKVVGIDISEIGIEKAREKAKSVGMKNIDFLVMDAEDLSFPDNSFELVCGTSILHHLDLYKAMKEIGRVLKPNGKAVFIEPLGTNPVINLYRRLTPSLRTKDEQPFRTRDLLALNDYFLQVNVEYFHFLSLLAVPLRKAGVFVKILNGLDMADRCLFKLLPFMRAFAWQTIIIMEGPKKYLSSARN